MVRQVRRLFEEKVAENLKVQSPAMDSSGMRRSAEGSCKSAEIA